LGISLAHRGHVLVKLCKPEKFGLIKMGYRTITALDVDGLRDFGKATTPRKTNS
jgi:hypothetical protein